MLGGKQRKQMSVPPRLPLPGMAVLVCNPGDLGGSGRKIFR